MAKAPGVLYDKRDGLWRLVVEEGPVVADIEV